MNRSIAATIFSVLLAGLPGAVPFDDPPTTDPKAEADRATLAVRLAKDEASLYRLKLEGSNDLATLNPDALLQWSNPVVGSIHGSVYVWTDRGCPVAIASIYKWFSPNLHLGVEFHSLSPTLATGERKGRVLWSPGRTAIDRKPIPGAPKPAETPAARLRQLRALAGEFIGKSTTRANVVRDLRLLTQPIYRYQSTDPEVIDGAIFAYVQGTDPDIILMIEARKTKTGPEWQFAAARMNSLALTLNHKGVEAWKAPMISWEDALKHNQPYTFFKFGSDPGITFDDSGQ